MEELIAKLIEENRLNEERFAKAYAAAAATNPWEGFTLQWRTYIVCWFADHVKKLEGDYVECGVNTGAYSRAIVEYIEFNKLTKSDNIIHKFIETRITEVGIYLSGLLSNKGYPIKIEDIVNNDTPCLKLVFKNKKIFFSFRSL